jgi:hypothetical protein
MTDFIVEVTIPAATAAARINRAIRTTGSHFAAHASWWRRGGVVSGTISIGAADEAEALRAVPTDMRGSAHVRMLNALAA